MKNHEKYAEEVKHKVFETIECYESEETKLAILIIQGQIDELVKTLGETGDEDCHTYGLKREEYLKKSIDYLKEKL